MGIASASVPGISELLLSLMDSEYVLQELLMLHVAGR
jgi:hypothetical protein